MKTNLQISTVCWAAWLSAATGQCAEDPGATLQISVTPAITLTGPVGSVQQVEYSTNVTDPKAWTILSRVSLGTLPKPFLDTTARDAQRSYRSLMVGIADPDVVRIPPGTFLMGSPGTEEGRSTNEGPQTQVTLTREFFIGRLEVRNREYLAIMGSVPEPSDLLYSNYLRVPVRGVTWSEATNYCALRTALEQGEGKIPPDWIYRLPTEAEWEYACRAGSTAAFMYGNELRSDAVRVDAAFDGTSPYPPGLRTLDPISYAVPVPVASFVPNVFGLYDMHGNVDEWCLDGHDSSSLPPYSGGSVTNPVASLTASFKVVRGGAFSVPGAQCRSASRRARRNLGARSPSAGFRVVLIDTGRARPPAVLAAKPTPTVTIDTALVGSLQELQYSTNLGDASAWTFLSHVRMDSTPTSFFDTTADGPLRFYRTVKTEIADQHLVWIPPGTFLMGSPDTEANRSTNEGPQTLVTLTEGFYIGRFEVRYFDWLPLLSAPSHEDETRSRYVSLPVRHVLWDEATNYCAVRTASELASGKIPAGWAYRLPTEAEWEYACRAGSTTAFSHGNQLRADALRNDANFDAQYPYPTGLVAIDPIVLNTQHSGSYSENAFGLADMHGNVEEWCLDGPPRGESTPSLYSGGSVTNPIGSMAGTFKYVRGGWFLDAGFLCRSAAREVRIGQIRHSRAGFRVVLARVGV